MNINKSSQIYQLKVSLKGARPPIWRRILVSSDASLMQLHDIIQIVMGWDSYHLHAFTIGEQTYGDPADDMFGDFGTLDEAVFRLDQVIKSEGKRFTYEYDFGDSWHHEILLEKILPAQKDAHYPVCIKGKRACPPEDVGGIWGYKYFLEAIHNKDHEEHQSYLDWVGGEFDAEGFDLEQINKELSHMSFRGREDESFFDFEQDKDEEDEDLDAVLQWAASLSETEQALAEDLPFRRDMMAMLTYLRDNKVTGTQSTGNFPLKAVAEICASFVTPHNLEKELGKPLKKVRSEFEVRHLYLLHVLAEVCGLITGGPSRRWKLSYLAENFLNLPAELQIWLLAVNWWTTINWAIAAPHYLQHTEFPALFALTTLQHLLELPIEEPVDFKPFADELIKKSSLVWSIEDQKIARIILHRLIEKTVVAPQLNFGILEATYHPEDDEHEEILRLTDQIKISAFGHSLLKIIREVAFL